MYQIVKLDKTQNPAIYCLQSYTICKVYKVQNKGKEKDMQYNRKLKETAVLIPVSNKEKYEGETHYQKQRRIVYNDNLGFLQDI